MSEFNHAQELDDFKEYFKTAKFPETPFMLNKHMRIHDVDSTIAKSVRDIESYKGSEIVLDSLFNHLRELKAIIENG